ncbi:hypothetical protein EVAR_17109_1 [Eumeta japonica]|uniref:Reverse transcriptase domain-containing protein n=1 Tax=Eumeta variegata TaxID=151549 RepID=A0A4C1UM67_EUMVA|nr:hypothetical protein EVAR_17109_1 [Eumeta japonica]
MKYQFLIRKPGLIKDRYESIAVLNSTRTPNAQHINLRRRSGADAGGMCFKVISTTSLELSLFERTPLQQIKACGLQKMVNKIIDSVKKRGMKVNVDKTKVMVFEGGEITSECEIFIGEKVEQVEEFVYLGSLFTNDDQFSTFRPDQNVTALEVDQKGYTRYKNAEVTPQVTTDPISCHGQKTKQGGKSVHSMSDSSPPRRGQDLMPKYRIHNTSKL